jgi:hypothetical protein
VTDPRAAAPRRLAWPLTALLIGVVVAASVGAALFGWAARGATADPPARPVPGTELPVPAAVAQPAPPSAVEVLSARLSSLDATTRGIATLLDTPSGPVVRLTDFETHAGRGYVVYLVPEAAARTPSDGTMLGPLMAVSGDQNYVVPTGVRTDGPLTLLIWSRGFKGPVAHATLRH